VAAAAVAAILTFGWPSSIIPMLPDASTMMQIDVLGKVLRCRMFRSTGRISAIGVP